MLPRLFLSYLWLAVTVSADCTRELLKNATAQYVTSQTSGQINSFTALASNITYTENFQLLDIKTGVLSQPVELSTNLSIHDPTLCATFTQLIAADNTHPYVIGTRMLFTGDKGDWLFNATGYLHWTSLEKWDPISEDQHDSRETIQAPGDAYFNRFAGINVTVPYGTPCARLEGGAYTDTKSTGTNTCNLGLPSNTTVVGRRYVVDEETGVVDIYLGFPGLDRSVIEQAMPDSHLFRVEGGKIRYIHTLSSCVNPGCGFNGTIIPTRYQRVRRY
ncbi:hypothetical protein M426DRAFT_259656 [Hypoxylon sp. CI-4A]|nr:hypothetical protein M426DRAFT_259656 [Hypoxylon sp. CI-4A]